MKQQVSGSRQQTAMKFRDTSAWYHIVLAVDTTQSTATDRFKLYVNGELVTSYYSRNNPAQNFDTSNNQADNSCTQHIGAYTVSGTAYGKFCGYIAEVQNKYRLLHQQKEALLSFFSSELLL